MAPETLGAWKEFDVSRVVRLDDMCMWFSSIRLYVRGPASTCQFMLVVKYLRPDRIEISVAYDNFFADHIRRSLSLYFFAPKIRRIDSFAPIV